MHRSLGRLDEAEADYRAALRLAPPGGQLADSTSLRTNLAAVEAQLEEASRMRVVGASRRELHVNT